MDCPDVSDTVTTELPSRSVRASLWAKLDLALIDQVRKFSASHIERASFRIEPQFLPVSKVEIDEEIVGPVRIGHRRRKTRQAQHVYPGAAIDALQAKPGQREQIVAGAALQIVGAIDRYNRISPITAPHGIRAGASLIFFGVQESVLAGAQRDIVIPTGPDDQVVIVAAIDHIPKRAADHRIGPRQDL